MTNEEIIAKINEILTEEFEVDSSVITQDGVLKDVLELDSLDYVDMVVMLEGNFGFKVKQEDFMSIKTFQHLYEYVIGKVNQTASV